MKSLLLKPGRERSLLRRHPWIFSGAIDKVDGDPTSGETVDVLAHNGQFLARAAFSPTSQIRARVWTFDRSERINADFFQRKVSNSILFRDRLNLKSETNAFRLVHAESDDLPGLIVDQYNQMLVIQLLSAGADLWRDTIKDILCRVTGLSAIYERSDVEVRQLEGLAQRTGLLHGSVDQFVIPVRENGLNYQVAVANGQKTGFYLDQRDNRLKVKALAKQRDVLDCFCYTGGFTVNALAGEARSVLSVDSSAEALTLCQENVALNPVITSSHAVMEGDVFHLLRKFRDEGRSFDMIILDPPKFAPTASQAEKASRAYKDINLLAFKLLRPGGLLVTFSCSGGVDGVLFQKIVASAALDAGVEVKNIATLVQSPDHPVALNFPEGAYLKGLICMKA